jgi:hypothetical protein
MTKIQMLRSLTREDSVACSIKSDISVTAYKQLNEMELPIGSPGGLPMPTEILIIVKLLHHHCFTSTVLRHVISKVQIAIEGRYSFLVSYVSHFLADLGEKDYKILIVRYLQ